MSALAMLIKTRSSVNIALRISSLASQKAHVLKSTANTNHPPTQCYSCNITKHLPVRLSLVRQRFDTSNKHTNWPASVVDFNGPLIATAAAPFSTKHNTRYANKTDTTKETSVDLFGDSANMGLFAKFKHMYKKYWYVLIPVHLTTSLGWFGAFYYLSKCGVDVPGLLQYVHLSETIIEKVQGSDMGHYAIAYLCYKVATPLRYALTLGGTTISIKYLVQAGHIKPMPSKRELMKMYEDKKAIRSNARSDQKEVPMAQCKKAAK